jgi:hypothetical protein
VSRYMLTIPSGLWTRNMLERVRHDVGARSTSEVIRRILKLPLPSDGEPTEQEQEIIRERMTEQYRRACQ